MPQYLFQCKTCDNRQVVDHSMFADFKPPVCLLCNNPMQRLYDFAKVQFKGGGFYSTDK